MARLTVREALGDYPYDSWIVTGAIHSGEVRLFSNRSDAMAYAGDLVKKLKDYPNLEVVIEPRCRESVANLRIE